MGEELSLIENDVILDNTLKVEQEKFLNTNLGIIINNAVDISLKALLPDLIEEEIISIKDTILENGLKQGIDEAVKTAVNFGKSTLGIVTGKFENMEQVDLAIKKGGIVDTISDVLDTTIKKVEDKELINKSTAKMIKSGKNTILDSITDKLEDSMRTQIKNVEKLQNYSEKWKEAYQEKDFSKMSKNYKNIEKYLNETIPLENTIKEARKIENLHNLIKNNGENFNISKEEQKLAEKLIN